ncbi:MAG: pyridoxal 5'-phosphate synthase glutaminase subunit PdxT [Coriobacteriales bacterium]|jgi:5'-phosphate synthase pdxT subunit
MRIAVLALQGAFAEHEQMFEKLGATTLEIRQANDLSQQFDALVIPGGESTVQGKLLADLGLLDPIRELIRKGLPVWGTCAGLLLLARRIENDNRSYLATMDMTAVRNAYGRQLGSFATRAEFKGAGEVPMTFIRAPYIASVGPSVEVLSSVDGKIVAARQGQQLATSFHPELTDDTSIHEYFLEMARTPVFA